MKGVLYIPYIDTESYGKSEAFNISSIDYINQLNNVKNNIIGGDSYLKAQDKNSVNFNNVNKKQNIYEIEKTYRTVECEFLNMDSEPETFDELLDNYNNKISFIMLLDINQDESDEDAILELKAWVNESNKVNKLPDELYNDDDKMNLLPTRQFKIGIDKAKAYLNNCKFIDILEGKIGIFVQEIMFVN